MEKINGITPRNKSRPFRIKENLVGKHFGNWKVLRRVEDTIYPNGRVTAQWLCECQCEKKTKKIFKTKNLKYASSCGCIKKEKLEGKFQSSFLKTRIVENGKITKKKCGDCKQWKDIKEFYKSSRSRDGYRPSCISCIAGNPQRRYTSTVTSAKKRGFDFFLSREDFLKITSQPCFYCNQFSSNYKNIPYVGIDRVDPTLGYEVSNVVPCCKRCNQSKLDFSLIDFITQIKKIYNFLGLEKYAKNESM